MLGVHQKFLIHICFLLLLIFKISSLTRPHVLINFSTIWPVFYRSKIRILNPRETLFEDNMQSIKAAFIKTKIKYSGFIVTFPIPFSPMIMTGDSH